MTIRRELLDELARRRAEADAGGGPAKLEERHKKGLLGARERIEGLFDQASFQELGRFAQHTCRDFGMEGRKYPGDGVITGFGCVDGRPVACFSQDFSVGGGSLGRAHSRKITDVMNHALKMGMPVVGFNDSGGARIQEGVDSLSGYGQVFFTNVLLSGVVPQIAVIAGPCAGGAAYSPALMDFVIMTRKNATLFICGPEVIRAATGVKTTAEEIGSADAHATASGNIHFVAEDDRHASEIVKRLLSYLPSNNLQDPPHQPTDIDLTPDLGMDELVPEDIRDALDVSKVIERLVDPGSFLEVQRDFAPNIVVGFARIFGMIVGIVANQPMVKAGALDIDSSDKAARFIRFCNAFNMPLISLVDVPGFLPGVQQERQGIIRHGAKMLFAWAGTTVPKVTVILRKAYGGAYLAMCSKDMGADLVYAWPTAEIAVMGAEGAVNILYRDELKQAPDRQQRHEELVRSYRERFAAPWQAANNGLIGDVIEPSRTRAVIGLALQSALTKRISRPPKKHGNISL